MVLANSMVLHLQEARWECREPDTKTLWSLWWEILTWSQLYLIVLLCIDLNDEIQQVYLKHCGKDLGCDRALMTSVWIVQWFINILGKPALSFWKINMLHIYSKFELKKDFIVPIYVGKSIKTIIFVISQYIAIYLVW